MCINKYLYTHRQSIYIEKDDGRANNGPCTDIVEFRLAWKTFAIIESTVQRTIHISYDDIV